MSVMCEPAIQLWEWPLCLQRITSGTPASMAVDTPPLLAQAQEKEVVSIQVALRPCTIIRKTAVGPETEEPLQRHQVLGRMCYGQPWAVSHDSTALQPLPMKQ